MNNKDPGVILLDTKSRVIYWMNCPVKVQETASPRSSYLVYPLEGEDQGVVDTKEDDSDGNEDEESDEDEDQEDGEDEGEDEIKWGSCWPVPHLFEMLKNQFCQPNFIPRNKHKVIDIRTESTRFQHIPETFTDFLQAIYRKHGWPDISNYQKDDCLAELKQELDEKFPGHHMYYLHTGE